ncbi:hypothetical protein, partial [Bradyrhizobium sp.]|uniref:hypothetical protein n=1 Tax=Bradyrhizobium sp. TaxID=376 RepID=UPI003BB1E413
MVLDAAFSGKTSPSRRKIEPRLAPHNSTADLISVSRTVWRSKVERLMTLNTSAVAVCCAIDSSSLRLRSAMVCWGSPATLSVTMNIP